MPSLMGRPLAPTSWPESNTCQKEDAGDRPWLCTLGSSHGPMRLAPEEADAGSMHLVSEGAGIELDVGDVFVGASAGVA